MCVCVCNVCVCGFIHGYSVKCSPFLWRLSRRVSCHHSDLYTQPVSNRQSRLSTRWASEHTHTWVDIYIIRAYVYTLGMGRYQYVSIYGHKNLSALFKTNMAEAKNISYSSVNYKSKVWQYYRFYKEKENLWSQTQFAECAELLYGTWSIHYSPEMTARCDNAKHIWAELPLVFICSYIYNNEHP